MSANIISSLWLNPDASFYYYFNSQANPMILGHFRFADPCVFAFCFLLSLLPVRQCASQCEEHRARCRTDLSLNLSFIPAV